MDIGTAKPTAAERQVAKFHLLDLAAPDEQLTVAAWRNSAEAAIGDIEARGRKPIVCGGTGLYIRALLDGWNLAQAPPDAAVRESLHDRFLAVGAQGLYADLANVDPEAAERIHPNDSVRMMRALEVYHVTGKTISWHLERDRADATRRPARVFGRRLPRPRLYRRIERRVDQMVAEGLEREVRGLLERGFGHELKPMLSLGYKEFVQYVNGQMELCDAIEAMKQSTRRYAKRQITWFGADPSVDWIDVDGVSSAEVASRIIARLEAAAGAGDPA
jgi:tRNA dimethylallyltransferase